MLVLWLGLGTKKKHLVGLEKHHFWLKIPDFVDATTAEYCPKVFQKSSSVTLAMMKHILEPWPVALPLSPTPPGLKIRPQTCV